MLDTCKPARTDALIRYQVIATDEPGGHEERQSAVGSRDPESQLRNAKEDKRREECNGQEKCVASP